jgi:hypothetical protein
VLPYRGFALGVPRVPAPGCLRFVFIFSLILDFRNMRKEERGKLLLRVAGVPLREHYVGNTEELENR